MMTGNRVEALFADILGAGDFANAYEIMRRYDGPVEPDLAHFMEDSFSSVPPHDTARAAAGYRVALALFQAFATFPDASAHQWKKVGLDIALAALAHLPAVRGLEPNIRLLAAVGDLYAKEDDGKSAHVLVRVMRYYDQASKLLTDDVDRELSILIWGVLAGLNSALFKHRMAELDEELSRQLRTSLTLIPLDEASYRLAVDIDEVSAEMAEKRQQMRVYQDESIRCFECALALSEGRYGRAYTLIDVAQTLAERGETEDICRAAASYQAALGLLDQEIDRELYAKSALELGTLYRKHSEAFGEESMEAARQCLEEARELLKDGPLEELWEVVHDLALIYGSFSTGDVTRNRARALDLMKEAVRVGEQAGLHRGKLILSYAGLGLIYEHQFDQLEEARPWYEKAYELLETQRWAEGFKPLALVETFHDVYRGLTRVQLHDKKESEAFVTASRGRARYLTDALAYRHTTPSSFVPQELWLQATEARNAHAEKGDRDHAARSRYARVLEEIEHLSPAAARILQLQPVTVGDVGGAISPQQALLVLYPSRVDVLAFLVRPPPVEPAVSVIQLSKRGLLDLFHAVVVEWVVAYEDFRWTGLPTLERLENVQHSLDQLITEVSSTLELSRLNPLIGETRHLLVVAHHPLQLVPIHALPFGDGQRLLDMYDVSYLPSVAAAVLPGAGPIDQAQSFLAISNPRPHPPWHLAYSALESSASASFFQKRLVLEGNDATRFEILKAFGERAVLHLSCHGVHNFTNMAGIRLLLAGQESLNVNDVVLAEGEQATTRLAVLSACESGLADAVNFGDEFFNFPSLLLRAGIPSIVYSLWQVEERATALILYLFYRNLIDRSLPAAHALRLAQLWLRDACGEQLADLAEEMVERAGEVDLPAGFRSWIKRQRTPARRNVRPYCHPYFWSAFCHMGA